MRGSVGASVMAWVKPQAAPLLASVCISSQGLHGALGTAMNVDFVEASIHNTCWGVSLTSGNGHTSAFQMFSQFSAERSIPNQWHLSRAVSIRSTALDKLCCGTCLQRLSLLATDNHCASSLAWLPAPKLFRIFARIQPAFGRTPPTLSRVRVPQCLLAALCGGCMQSSA